MPKGRLSDASAHESRHDRRSPRSRRDVHSETEEAPNPTDKRRGLAAFLAWPDSPVRVLMYWLPRNPRTSHGCAHSPLECDMGTQSLTNIVDHLRKITGWSNSPLKKKPGLSHPPDFAGKGQAPP